jgi:hypothetical protein
MRAQGKVSLIAEDLLAVRTSHLSVRLVAQRTQVETAIHQMYASLAELTRSGSYDLVLGRPVETDRLNPMVFVSSGSQVLWSGDRPLILGKLLRRGRLGLDKATLVSLGWGLLAAASPAALRRMLSVINGLKNRAARREVEPGRLYEWQPPGFDQPAQ